MEQRICLKEQCIVSSLSLFLMPPYLEVAVGQKRSTQGKSYSWGKAFQDRSNNETEIQIPLFLSCRTCLGNFVEPLTLHFSMFTKTLETQTTDAQKEKWLPLLREVKIIGTYAQTELGHG